MAIDNKNKVLNVPHLRFPEFSGEWKNTSLGKIGKTFNGLTGKSGADFGRGFPYITYKSIFDDSKIDISRVEYVEITDVERKKETQNEVQYGDVFFTTSSETPDEVGMSSVLLDEIKDCYLNSFCFGYRLNSLSKTIPDYMRFYLRSQTIRKKMFVLAQGSTRFNISKSEVMGISINIPETKEQRKIANLLTLLDERIATQNKIIEDLKKLKCAIIEKVLNGNNANNLRLGDVGSYIRGLTYSSDDVVEYNSTLVMRSNNIVNGSLLDYQNNVVSVNKQISQEQQLQDGDIIICMANGSSALVGKSSFYDGKCISPITVGAFCGIYRSKTAITKWLFQTNRYRRYIWNSLQGGNGAIANLNSEDILRMSFPLPDKQTAERCIKLLSSLESLIESNISLCSKFFQQKEYLLRQMFI
mgnify:CR=1 FL=1